MIFIIGLYLDIIYCFSCDVHKFLECIVISTRNNSTLKILMLKNRLLTWENRSFQICGDVFSSKNC